MKKVSIVFEKCIQDSQDFGGNDEHMVSRVFFKMHVNDQNHDNLYANIKQSVGGNYESDPIEVSLPVGYNGLLNYQKFQEETEKYYRSSLKSAIGRIGGNVRMRNNVFSTIREIQFEVDEKDFAW